MIRESRPICTKKASVPKYSHLYAVKRKIEQEGSVLAQHRKPNCRWSLLTTPYLYLYFSRLLPPESLLFHSMIQFQNVQNNSGNQALIEIGKKKLTYTPIQEITVLSVWVWSYFWNRLMKEDASWCIILVQMSSRIQPLTLFGACTFAFSSTMYQSKLTVEHSWPFQNRPALRSSALLSKWADNCERPDLYVLDDALRGKRSQWQCQHKS